MLKIAMVLAYDGTDFHGYQIQRPGIRTVQGELESSLESLIGCKIGTLTSGRTDAGVHARGQVIAFYCPVPIPVEKIHLALNARLPEDIRVITACQASEDFNPRFDAVSKTYLYTIDCSETGNVFRRRSAYYFPYPIDLDEMKLAASNFVGTHDFTSFCAAATPLENRVRTIYNCQVDARQDDRLIHITITGNGFLWNMVRIIVGTLLDVGRGKFQAEQIQTMLLAKNRTKSGHTAPARGLQLWQVQYENEELNLKLFSKHPVRLT